MVLPSFAAVPPMVLTEALSWMWTPSEPLPSGWVPVLSVPMKLPSTRMSGGAALEDQAVLVVAGDDVAGGGRRAADDVADGGQLDAVLVVGDGDGAGAVGADEVALDGVVADGAGIDAVGDAVAAVAGDEVAGARDGAADGIVVAAQEDAVELVADGLVAAGVGADLVPLDGDAERRVLEVDAGLVAGDDVGVGGLGPADERAGAVVDLDAVVGIAQRHGCRWHPGR